MSNPAIEDPNGWYRNGQLHRTDGPAIEYTSGTNKWYLNGQEYTESEFTKVK